MWPTEARSQRIGAAALGQGYELVDVAREPQCGPRQGMPCRGAKHEYLAVGLRSMVLRVGTPFEPPSGSSQPVPTTGRHWFGWLGRSWRLPAWAWLLIGIALIALGGVSTASRASKAEDDLASSQSEIDELNDKVDSLDEAIQANEDTLAAAQTAQSDAETKLKEMESAVATAEAARDEAISAKQAAEAERDTAAARAVVAEEDRNAVITQFDPQIQAAVAELQSQAAVAACGVATERGARNAIAPRIDEALKDFIATIPAAVLSGRDPITLFDPAPITQSINDCWAAGQQQYAAAQAQAQAEQQQAVLFGPRGDGLYSVGLEMGAGKWRSNGSGDSCYWKRSPDGNPDDILDNHFGLAGGSVTVHDGEEFETEGCGIWEFVG